METKKSFIKGAGLLFEDEQIIVVATGANGARKSANEKTGGMAQIWILVRNEDPVSAVKSGADKANCFDCPFRGVLNEETGEFGAERGCYLTKYDLARAPLAIWKAYHRGRYEQIVTDEQIAKLFSNKSVRFGAYGEPIKIPYSIVARIFKVANRNCTGYTHQWRNPLFAQYKQFFMASTTDADYQLAQSMGWRTFAISSRKLENQIVCPASAERGYKLTCEQCGLCTGLTRAGARSVQIAPHGSGAKYVEKIAA